MSATMKKTENIFLKMHPLVRFCVCLVLAAVIFMLLPRENDFLLKLVISWVVFAFLFIVFSWIVVFTRTVPDIKKKAAEDDGSVAFVFFMVIISSFAGMLSVLLLMISKDTAITGNGLFLPACISGMILAWTMVHTIYIFHYAHEYYNADNTKPAKILGGLNFPEDNNPDYLDFAYFSFVMGCTFQVSDVNITSKRIRRIALVHGILSFILNTFVIALTINLIAGLRH